MADAQQEVINYLKSLGYVIVRECHWPVLEHPSTGTRIRVACDGTQHEAGYSKPNG